MNSSNGTSLRFLAKQAKNRLRNCNAQSEIIAYRGYDNIAGCQTNAFEKMMYAKVAQILESDEHILNPLDRMVDRNLVEMSDEANRQKLMLETSKLFIKLKQKYYESVANLG